jgi:selenocysteine lyase/cysteine desulfurase
MAERALEAGAFVFMDACQSVGQVPTDWLDCAADVVVCSGRKFVGGPRGTAFVSLSQRFLDQATPREADICGARIGLDLRLKVEFPIGLMERWEGNIAGYLGLGIAADETLAASGDREVRRRARLTESIRDALRSIRGVEICDPPDVDYASTLTFVVHGVEAAELVARCRRAGVFISEVETYTAPLDLPARVGRDVNRISVGRTTVESDIECLVASLMDATK